MLWLERRVVAALAGDVDPEQLATIEQYVDGSLRSMPELLRAGVAGESLLLGALPRLAAALGTERDDVARRLARWQRSRIDVIRQYARLLNSLTLFARQELRPTTAR